jgi:hypothetical protein
MPVGLRRARVSFRSASAQEISTRLPLYGPSFDRNAVEPRTARVRLRRIYGTVISRPLVLFAT